MKLFMSKEEKTGRALDQLWEQCAKEANEMFNRALTELKNGKSNQSNRVRKLGELSSMRFGRDFCAEESTSKVYIELCSDTGLAGLYKHVLYTGLFFKKLQNTTDKYLSEEALKPFHRNSDLLHYMRRFSPAKKMTSDYFDMAEYYLLHGATGFKSGDLNNRASFHQLMEARIELF